MKERLEEISKMTKEKVEQITTSQELKELKAKVLGKKSELTEILRGMGQIAAEQRPVVGELVNKVRTEIEEMIEGFENEEYSKKKVLSLLENIKEICHNRS